MGLTKEEPQSKTLMDDPLIVQIVSLHHYLMHYDVFMSFSKA